MEVLNVVATVSAAVAALAALGALVIAWKTLKEGRGTIAELRKLSAAAQAETEAARETTRALYFILTETRLARELEALRSIATQIPVVIAPMRLVHDTNSHWHELNDAKQLLAAQLAGAGVDLTRCDHLASPSTDPRFDDRAQDQATQEIRAAIDNAKARLAELNAAFPALLKPSGSAS